MKIQPKFSNADPGFVYTTNPTTKAVVAKGAITPFKEHVPNKITGTAGTAVYYADLDRMRESLEMVGHEVVTPY